MTRNCIKCGIQEDTSEGTVCHNFERHLFPEPAYDVKDVENTTTIWVVLQKNGDYMLDHNDVDEHWEYTDSDVLRAFHTEVEAIAFKNSILRNDDIEVKSCELE